ncbi:MAG: NAD(+)/NADH kinase [Coprococcus sp.]
MLLGGDGTLLRGSQGAASAGIFRCLGISLGTLGFLTSAEKSESCRRQCPGTECFG